MYRTVQETEKITKKRLKNQTNLYSSEVTGTSNSVKLVLGDKKSQRLEVHQNLWMTGGVQLVRTCVTYH